jgi:hypothetical protein
MSSLQQQRRCKKYNQKAWLIAQGDSQEQIASGKEKAKPTTTRGERHGKKSSG